MFCYNCGSSMSDNAKFCPACGASVGKSAGDTADVTAAETAGGNVPGNAPIADTTPVYGGTPPYGEPNGTVQQQNPVFPTAKPVAYGVGAAVPVSVSGAPAVKKISAASVVFGILFGLISTVLLVAGGGIFSVRSGLEQHALSDEIRNIDLGTIVVGDILMSDKLEEACDEFNIVLPDSSPKKANVLDVLELSAKVPGDAITRSQFKEIIKKLDISDEVADIASAYETYLVTGEDELEDELADYIKTLVLHSENSVYNVTGHRLNSSFKENIDDYVVKYEDQINAITPSETLGKYYSTISLVISPVIFIAAFALVVVLTALVGVISKNVSPALISGGAACVVSGGVLMIAGAVLSDLSFIKGLNYTVVRETLSPMIHAAFGTRLLYAGLIIAGIGLCLVIAFAVVKIVSAAKRKKAAQ